MRGVFRLGAQAGGLGRQDIQIVALAPRVQIAGKPQGRLLVEVLRRLVFDHLEKRLTSEDEESQDIDNQGFFFLAKAIKEMSQANRLDQDFEAKVRERIQKEMEKKLDAAAGRAAAESSGLTPEQALERMKAIYRGEA